MEHDIKSNDEQRCPQLATVVPFAVFALAAVLVLIRLEYLGW